MSKVIHQADSLEWLPAHPGVGSVVTSLPDAEEVDMSAEEWGPWFMRATVACMSCRCFTVMV